jgi:hypothetical protein
LCDDFCKKLREVESLFNMQRALFLITAFILIANQTLSLSSNAQNMWPCESFVSFSTLLPLFTTASAWQQCKAVPGTPSWPSPAKWAALNQSIDGRLLQPSPPAAACHADEPEYNFAVCANITQDWTSIDFQPNLPNGNAWDNWNNDSCLPDPTKPCSGEGYPVYVINATSSEDVKHGIDFARYNNVRLIVKGTGVDYLGR